MLTGTNIQISGSKLCKYGSESQTQCRGHTIIHNALVCLAMGADPPPRVCLDSNVLEDYLLPKLDKSVSKKYLTLTH